MEQKENIRWRRIVLTLVIVVAAWLVRLVMFPGMPLVQHIMASLGLIILLQVIWEVFAAIHKYLDRRFPFSINPYWRIAIQITLGVIIILGFITAFIFLVGDHLPFPLTNVTKGMMIVSQVLVSIVINMTFISSHFMQQWKDSLVEAERFEKEKARMQYYHLKNQVNPHFLFNTLTSLDALTRTDPELASRYIGHLAKVYRYVLEHEEQEVVPLKEELAFISHYISLQKIRFRSGFQIDIEVGEAVAEKGIVMVTLQLLIDNAIKHNEVHEKFPLRMRIWNEDGYLLIQNTRRKKHIPESSKQGLKQLSLLYGYLCDRPVRVVEEQDYFTVKVPLL